MTKIETREQVRVWVVMNAGYTNPYKKYWSAYTSLGYDINGTGPTLEKAYQALTDEIYNSKYWMEQLNKIIGNGKDTCK